MTPDALQAFAEPEIAARVRVALAGAGAAGILVLVAGAVLPRTAPARAVVLPAARSGLAYLMLGLGSRFFFQHHRSRLQIAVLLGVVAAVEIVRSGRGRSGTTRLASWFVSSVAVCLGVIAAKWALEPGELSGTLNRLLFKPGHA